MGRMHSNGKGMADSALPYKRTAPAWLKTPASEVEEQVSKLAKKGLMPSQVRHCRARLRPLCPAYARARAAPAPRPRRSPLAPVHSVVLQIGVILRDSHGIAQVKSVAGQKILRILKKQGLAPTLPEDLYHLIKKAVSVRKHLERNRNDKDSKFRLILVESRIHRIARYYKIARQLPPHWRYESATASTLVA